MATVSYRLNHPTNTAGVEKSTPVAINVIYCHKSIQLELSTGQKVVPAKWTGSRVKGVDRADKINKHLSNLENKLLNVHIDHHEKTLSEQREIARKIIKGGADDSQKKTFIEAVQRFIAQYEKEKEEGTVKRYKVVLNKLIAFNPNLTFEELDQNFYDSFKDFLYNQPNPGFSGYHLEYDRTGGFYLVCPNSDTDTSLATIGLFDDTVFKYFINISSILTWAGKRGYPINPAYKEWQIIKREYPPISLTEDELERIEDCNFKEKHLDIARDYLSLECRTGQRISDLRRFNASDLRDSVWHLTQKKGNRTKAKHIQLPLVGFCAPALVILEKYNFKLPTISEQKLNENIKTVCKLAGINQVMYIERYAGNKKIRIPGSKDEFISTHTGKKTFITLLAGQGVPVKVISGFTGTSIKTIERHYLGDTDIATAVSWLTKNESVKNKSIMRITG